MPPLTEFVQGTPRLGGRTAEEKQQYLRELADRFAEEYDSLLPRLAAAVAGAHPLHLLALSGMASAFTQSSPGADRAPGVMLQAFTEVIQAFALRTPQNDAQRILAAAEVKEIQDLAARVSGAFHMRRLRDLAEVSGIEDSRRRVAIEAALAPAAARWWMAAPDEFLQAPIDTRQVTADPVRWWEHPALAVALDQAWSRYAQRVQANARRAEAIRICFQSHPAAGQFSPGFAQGLSAAYR